MNEHTPPEDFDQHSQPRQGMSTGAKVGIGCGVVILIVLVLICGGALTWHFLSWGKYQEFGSEFEQQGYTLTEETAVDINSPRTGPLVIVGQAVNVNADVEGDLAIAARAANIESTVNGNLDFYGMVLNIGRNAHITGDIRIRSATAVNIEGIVDGTLSGEWTALEDRRRQQPDQPEQPEQPTEP